MKRVCKECNVEKDLNDYYLKKECKVKSSLCKNCYNLNYKSDKEKKKIYYEKNKEMFHQKNKKWLEENRESRNEYVNKWREENKDILREKRKEYEKNNKELIGSIRKKWYEDNKDKVRERERERYKEKRNSNLEIEREKKREYVSEKMQNDPLFKLKFNLRSLIRNSIKRKFTNKSKKTIEILGCSFEEFKIYLESKFDANMNWDNQGSYWHLDHIKPVSLAKDEKELYELNHYTNFQPLFWLENITKGNKFGD